MALDLRSVIILSEELEVTLEFGDFKTNDNHDNIL